jgi:hypothetical protein
MNKGMAGDLIETEPGGYDIGRDPRKISRDVLAKHHAPMPVLKALRAKCIDCCAGSESELRKCTALACPLSPFRMGTNPHRDTSNYSGAGLNERRKNSVSAVTVPEPA